MKLRDYIIRRLILLVPVLIGVSVITFALTRLVGNPAAVYIDERCSQSNACIAAVMERYGFNQPVPVQYLRYVWSVLHGDLGVSRTAAWLPVTEAIMMKFPATFELASASMILAVLLGIPLGVVSATRRNRPVDHASRVFALSGVSVPVFWFGLMLKFALYWLPFVYLGSTLLPISGRAGRNMYDVPGATVPAITNFYLVDSVLALSPDGLIDAIAHLLMPALTLSFVTMALITRMMRSSMLEVMNQEYIKTARSKGLSEKVVVKKHARRNAMIPTITVIGLSFGGLLGGAVLTETIFDWPGLGQWSALAITMSDQAAVLGFTLLAAVIYVLANLVVDIVYAYLDPRIRLGE
ncbi:MAG: ABC transporter permease [Methanobacteriota archaeon]|nr:MAG: ABC transporter permease [Euryarchaeota archaeon]